MQKSDQEQVNLLPGSTCQRCLTLTSASAPAPTLTPVPASEEQQGEPPDVLAHLLHAPLALWLLMADSFALTTIPAVGIHLCCCYLSRAPTVIHLSCLHTFAFLAVLQLFSKHRFAAKLWQRHKTSRMLTIPNIKGVKTGRLSW